MVASIDFAAAQSIDDYSSDARGGDAAELYNAGLCYKYGYGTAVDEIEAFRWLRLAAEQGYADAQTQIGVFYHDGYAGLKPNATEALNWHTKAAEQGSALSQYLLGRQYLRGDGVGCNYEAAFGWIDKAAQQGLAMAYTLRGRCYLDGEGVAADTREANRLLRKGADGGDSEALDYLARRFAAVCPAIEFTTEATPESDGFVYESYGNGCYFGQIDRRGRRDGSGIYLWDSGVSYAGEWDDGECSGFGVTDYGTAKHYGSYTASLPEGNGLMICANGDTFEGLEGCAVYAGSFAGGRFNGTGTLYDLAGEVVYYGSFRDGRPLGEFPTTESLAGYRLERQEYGEGEVFEGETLDGLRNGLGIYRWADGALWVGVWSLGARGGDGIYISADGRTVSGTWLGNEMQ